MDKIDEKIMLELIKNSRISYTNLAKKCSISREVCDYRIKILREKGIINDFFTVIDTKKLGFTYALFFVRVKASYEKEFIEYLKSIDFIYWVSTHSGLWSLGMGIFGKDNDEVEKNFQKIYQKFKHAIVDHIFEFYKNADFFYEKYFNSAPTYLDKKFIEHKIDHKDKLILKLLSKNSRISSVEIAKETNLSAVAVANRINKLEKSGYILKYSTYINLSKMNKYHYAFFIKNKNLDDRGKLYSFLKAHPKVSFLIDYLGDPFIEFGVFVDDPYEVRDIAQKIEESFPDNRIVDFFMGQDDFISTGLPNCVFN